jgi:hypothetical protein
LTDISITASAVTLVSGPTEQMVAGATVTAGQVVYREAATGQAKLSDNDSATAEVRSVYGMALHASLAGQPLVVAKNGAKVAMGAIFTAGVEVYLSGTPGAIAPRADITTGDDPIRVGVPLTTSQLLLDFADPNVTL